MTTDECREAFLQHIAATVQTWANDPRTPSVQGKLDGLAFSILAALDGSSAGLPAFIVAPQPHPDDKEFNRSEGMNWWPENHESKVKADLAGSLHEHWHESQARFHASQQKTIPVPSNDESEQPAQRLSP